MKFSHGKQFSAPWAGLLAGGAGVLALLAYQRFFLQKDFYVAEQELGTFVYSYPLDLEEDEVLAEDETDISESAMLDEEMFPGHQE